MSVHDDSQAAGAGMRAVQAAYDAVADAYAEQLSEELADKPLDRSLLAGFLEIVGSGMVADLGCGPGHVTQFLAARNREVVGVDLSPRMIAVARESAPELDFEVGSMLDLSVADGVWAGIVAFYSIIHLTAVERSAAFREFARVLRRGGWLLVAFHIDSPDFASGDVNHSTSWFGHTVDLSGYFLDPPDVIANLEGAGFALKAEMDRQPVPGLEYPSRRCYLLAQRAGLNSGHADPGRGAGMSG